MVRGPRACVPVQGDLGFHRLRETLDGRGDGRCEPGAQGTVRSLDGEDEQPARQASERVGQFDGLPEAQTVRTRGGRPGVGAFVVEAVDTARTAGVGVGRVHHDGQFRALPRGHQPPGLTVAVDQGDRGRQRADGGPLAQPSHERRADSVVAPERVADADDHDAGRL